MPYEKKEKEFRSTGKTKLVTPETKDYWVHLSVNGQCTPQEISAAYVKTFSAHFIGDVIRVALRNYQLHCDHPWDYYKTCSREGINPNTNWGSKLRKGIPECKAAHRGTHS